MAGIQWSGGKCHGPGEAKALLRHNDKEQRLQHEHSNPDIDTALTDLNYSFFNKSYYQKIQDYDQMLSTVKCKRKSSGKNATVTMQDLVIYCPAGMMDEETGSYDYDLVCSWYRDVGNILQEKFGPRFIDMDIHFDEVHMYIEPQAQKCTWSRIHGHGVLIPAIPELDGDGKPTGEFVLNAKQFCTRKRIIDLNNEIHLMTLEKYGMSYMDGTKKKGKATVEDKKRDSVKALAEKEKQIAEHEADLQRREKEYREIIALGRRAKAEQLSAGIMGDDMDYKAVRRRLPSF